MNRSNAERARESTQQALEEEFAHLHGTTLPVTEGSTVAEREQALRRRTHYLVEERAPWALCLSGGGIRSATFCLGVLQGLAQRGMLRRFNYLSTVSGGGYIGSWLSRWLAASGGTVDEAERELAKGTESAASAEPAQVARLRAGSNYLSPVWGLSADFFTLVSIALRNLLLNWLVLLPLLAAALLVPYLYVGMLNSASLALWLNAATIVIGAACVVGGIAFVAAALPGRSGSPPRVDAKSDAAPGERGRQRDRFAPLCFVPMMTAAILLSVGLSWLSPLPSIGWQEVHIGLWFALAGAVLHGAGCLAGLPLKRLLARIDGSAVPSGVAPPQPADPADGGPGLRDRAKARGRQVAFIVLGGMAGGVMMYLLTQCFRATCPRSVRPFRTRRSPCR